MSINLTKNSLDGIIKSNNAPIILRGGHYWVFRENDNPPDCLIRPDRGLPFRVVYNNAPACQKTSFPVEQLQWQPGGGQLFDHMQRVNCNFLRIWLTGGTEVDEADLKPLDLTPFIRVKVGEQWKWHIYSAVVYNLWNEQYFRRLSAFAEAAENAGIVLQISLFNYFDLTRRFDGGNFRAWCRSPWNPALSEHPATVPDWGRNHLVNAGGSFSCADPKNDAAEAARQTFFLAPTNQLRTVQQALVRKVVQTLAARTNIIYEVMNEPRGDRRQSAAFSSLVTGWILSAAGTGRRPLISVNASNMTDQGLFDVDYWRDNRATIPHYDKLDAISYHGLTGFKAEAQEYCGKTPDVPPVDQSSIKARLTQHRQGHKTKSLIYCTDAARTGLHKFPDENGGEYELQTRDGQIFTTYPNVNSDPPKLQRIKSDLQNWAYWCFSAGAPYPGTVHFQNHSMNQMSFRRIGNALSEATTASVKLKAVAPAAEGLEAADETAETAPVI